jgi:chitin disaccharide deacetylase
MNPLPQTDVSSLTDDRTGIESSAGGFLVVNADDWGRDAATTDRIFECASAGAVSAVSAMVFMQDSERAAAMAADHAVDAGLHLNFTSAFTASGCPARLVEHQARVSRYLRRHRLAQIVFNPVLVPSFEYVVAAQIDEFRRIYGRDPDRLDGHHHMHLCANVLLQRLLPAGTVVRRNFYFRPGEKGMVNRTYRQWVDGALARRHRLADFLFSLVPLQPPTRLRRIFSLADRHVVEVETHPVQPDEYAFLAGGEILRRIGDVRIAPYRAVSQHRVPAIRGVR